MRVPPAAVQQFANQCIHLLPEIDITIGKQDQTRATNTGGGGGGLKSETTPINFTASETHHKLHLLLMEIMSTDDLATTGFVTYRTPVDAAKALWWAADRACQREHIEEQLAEGRKHLERLAHEIDLPPEPIPLGQCECGEPMVTTNEQTEVTCRRCELVWEVDERIAHRENKLDDVLTNYIGTAKEIADLAKAKGLAFRRKTISEWYRRGKIEAAGEREVNGRPAPTFRFEDVRKAHKKEVEAIRI